MHSRINEEAGHHFYEMWYWTEWYESYSMASEDLQQSTQTTFVLFCVLVEASEFQCPFIVTAWGKSQSVQFFLIQFYIRKKLIWV